MPAGAPGSCAGFPNPTLALPPMKGNEDTQPTQSHCGRESTEEKILQSRDSRWSIGSAIVGQDGGVMQLRCGNRSSGSLTLMDGAGQQVRSR